MNAGFRGQATKFSLRAALGAALLGGCGPAAPAPASPAPAPSASSGSVLSAPAARAVPEPPLAPLRTGTLAPIDDPPLELVLRDRADDGAFEILRFELPIALAGNTLAGGGRAMNGVAWRDAVVGLEPRLDAFAFVNLGLREGEREPSDTVGSLWVRRKKASGAVDGTLYLAAGLGEPGRRRHVHATLDPKAKTNAKLVKAWGMALAEHLETRDGAPSLFATARLRSLYGEPPARVPGRRALPRDPGDSLGRLMDTTTGRLSVQRALDRDRELYVLAAKQKPSVALEKVQTPRLAHHPWPAMKAALGTTTPDEPLARAVPAEFYCVRSKYFAKFLDLTDEIAAFGEPAADVLDGHAEERSTFARYETELGLERTALTRTLGPQVVTDLALVGSDPYVHEGSDVTLIFRVKNAPLFASALAGSLLRHSSAHPGITEQSFTEEGTTVTVRRSADGRVRQHRASVGEYELVSNSAAAIRRVIATIAGKHPSLAKEPDFEYMLARDAATPDDVLVYLGDRFIGEVVGPRQKIAEARRQLALGELLVPGYAALTLGMIDGRSPKTTADVLKSRLLRREELRHAGGEAIVWEPGTAARSSVGTAAALEPLLDRPPVTLVTPAEQAGYEQFARSYEAVWADRIDPIAFRATLKEGAGRSRELVGDLRVLPTLRSEYRDLMRTVGSARLAVPGLLGGFGVAVGLGAEAELRRDLTRMSNVFGAGKSFTFDWLGDYALLGVVPRNELAIATRNNLDKLELPASDAARSPRSRSQFAESLANLPVYAAIELKSRVGAGVFLAAVRRMASEVAPGLVTWGTAASHRGSEVVALRFSERGIQGALYYALTERAFVVSLNESVLHAVLDQLADRPPRVLATGAPGAAGASGTADAAQFVLELSGNPSDALYRSLAWVMSAAWSEQSNGAGQLAGSVFDGAPDKSDDPAAMRALMRAYLGTVILTPDGKDYVFSPAGVRDPDRGTRNAPSFPPAPVPGSPLERVLGRLARVRSDLSFDPEPSPNTGENLSSLHARVRLELR